VGLKISLITRQTKGFLNGSQTTILFTDIVILEVFHRFKEVVEKGSSVPLKKENFGKLGSFKY